MRRKLQDAFDGAGRCNRSYSPKGNIGFALREHRVGLACMERATTLYRGLGDDVALLRAQTLTGCVLTGLGRFWDAEPLLLDCLARGRDDDDDARTGDYMLMNYATQG
jgi:hypothetical protein